ncbi:3-hydroxyisobutyryl-CoA hydrolase-like protein 5 [Physcomitrium patens]|uniref:3-hydroxyisobutyryl-CoA hydrolase n=1 Tax=Physcomitrium patens TaxID=3218 RepID=A9SUT7_PHYPA|nr:3-hydroxyisobutyryl-CoA hydrolase-like protein 5 [Physcomitrium patens]XP_024360182.1 3-hydroxyisobutyryl-CoA hydrolase-like protein 5 [Physcomitrium patens]XP_024360183.1 3-hydroxyisobutyryl-CoA hydrolase-like protein 5 [Physcomitrium patens]XP_024360184.1 3-hydroxyisobutyryl-CoA hydrolase-like protein 5 [Physcomitrium patens]XP_024360185.1 3-hydroxyisobutyryl-CoA hydrolase-like protein 5 [Physcomitrium patens]PNR30650.1 hypothetical protein PHYPA_026966 [Physcomitrium patens]|eukprot:XP_024360180.1 3-hydroxyisobutyryl-CoA hydrolase-like protein 5 [Physcomitrella patens]
MVVANLDQAVTQPQLPAETELIIEKKGVGRFATMNRPRVLNCINLPMLEEIAEAYEQWEEDDSVGFIVLKGAGRVFCAGGDLKTFYGLGKSDESWTAMVYIKYWLDYHIATFKKPLVAIWHGLVMGGGAGLSVTGTFRVATEKTIFAMPEAGIGLHTDCGASYWLSRLSGFLGDYLGLTGHRLDGAEMYACGLATHFVPLQSLSELEKRLSELSIGDDASVGEVIESFHNPAPISPTSILHKQAAINRLFSKGTVEEIVEALEAELEETQETWVKETLKTLRRSSPMGLAVTFKSIRTGRNESQADTLKREYRLTINALKGTATDDFYEGIRSIVVDKDNAPKWNPKSIQEVTQEQLESVFMPFKDASKELQLPSEHEPRWSKKFVKV